MSKFSRVARAVRDHAGRVVLSGALLALGLWWGLGGLGLVPAAVAVLVWTR